MKGNNWQSLLLAALIGVVLSGGAMLVRGDMLGNQAAQQVEARLDKRIDGLKLEIGEDIKEIKELIKELREARRKP